MKKLFNYRPILILLLFLVTGIFSGFLRLKYSFTAVLIIFSVAILLMVLSFLFKKFHFNNNIFKTLAKYSFHFLIYFIVLILGYFLFTYSINNFDKGDIIDGESVYVTGEITDSYFSENGGYMLLEKATILSNEKNHNADKVFVYVYGNDKLPSKGNISFTAKVNINNIYENGKINSYSYRNNILYSFYINEDDYILSQGNRSIFLTVRQYIKDLLYQNLRYQNANICYALVTGDSLLMDKELKQAFCDIGIGHIFCVSGLHVGVLSALIIYLLNRLKVKRYYQVFICLAFLLFYAGICRFSPSVIRAIIMTEIYLLSKAAGQKYDNLSSLCFAAIIILLFSPLMLFDAGFLLSFCSVLGIILLYKKIKNIIKFLPNKISSLFAVSLSAQIGILPVIAVLFNNLPILSLLLNIIIVPLISIVYIILLILLLISFIKITSILFFLPQGIIEFVKIFVKALYNQNISNIYINGFGIGLIAFYITILLLSNYIFLKKHIKAISCLLFSAVFLFFALINNLPLNYNNSSVSAIANYSLNSSLITYKGKYYYIDYGSEKSNLDKLKTYLKQNSIIGIEAAFFTDYNKAARYISDLEYLNAKKYILPYGLDYPNIFSKYEAENKIKYLLSKEEYTYKTITFSSYYFNKDYYAGFVAFNGVEVLYIDSCTSDTLLYLQENLSNDKNSINIMFANTDIYSFKEYYNPKLIITKNDYQDAKNIYNINTYGSLIFNINNDKIIKQYKYRL